MAEIRIKAEPRTEFGKGAARRTRRAGLVPAVVYGHGSDTRHVSLPEHALMLALKSPNVLLELDLEGAQELTLPKWVQRDPVRQSLEHLDLVIVKRGEKVVVDVELDVVGRVPEGLLEVIHPTLSIEAEATNIPRSIEVDVDGFEIGASVYARDVVLPAGTILAGDPEMLVLHVVAPQAEEEPVEADVEEGEEGAAGAGAVEGAEGEPKADEA